MLTKDQLFVLIEHRQLTDDEVAAFNELQIPDEPLDDMALIGPWLKSIGIGTEPCPRWMILSQRLAGAVRRVRSR